MTLNDSKTFYMHACQFWKDITISLKCLRCSEMPMYFFFFYGWQDGWFLQGIETDKFLSAWHVSRNLIVKANIRLRTLLQLNNSKALVRFYCNRCIWEEHIGRNELMTGRIKAMYIVSYKLVIQAIILTSGKFCFSSWNVWHPRYSGRFSLFWCFLGLLFKEYISESVQWII